MTLAYLFLAIFILILIVFAIICRIVIQQIESERKRKIQDMTDIEKYKVKKNG